MAVGGLYSAKRCDGCLIDDDVYNVSLSASNQKHTAVTVSRWEKEECSTQPHSFSKNLPYTLDSSNRETQGGSSKLKPTELRYIEHPYTFYW